MNFTYDVVSNGGIILVNQKETSLFGFCCAIGIPNDKIKYENLTSVKNFFTGSHFSIFSETNNKNGLHSFVKEIYNRNFIGEMNIKLNVDVQKIVNMMIKENKYIQNKLPIIDNMYICSSTFEEKYFVFTNEKLENYDNVFKYYSDGEKRYRYLINKKEVERIVQNV